MLNNSEHSLEGDENSPLKKTIETLIRSIEKRAAITLCYKGGEKLQVEPYMLGFHKDTGKPVLWAFKSYPLELYDKKENWLLFEVDEIKNLQITPARAKNSRQKYFSLSAEMTEIIIEVSAGQKAI